MSEERVAKGPGRRIRQVRARRHATPRGVRVVARRLYRAGLTGVVSDRHNGAIRLTGEVDTWADWVRAGYVGVSVRCRGVVNDVVVPGINRPAFDVPGADRTLEGREYDVVVIGGGVIGCGIARELSRWALRIAVLEKEDDVGVHASSRNDGMVHPGFAPVPGTLKAHYNAAGNRMYSQLSDELGFRLKRVGSLVLFTTRWYWALIPILWLRARRNGVAGPVRFLSRREIRRREPNVINRQHGAMFLPSTGVVNPFEVTIALGENAARNGVEFHFETVATGFETRSGDGGREISHIHTNRGTIAAGTIVNAAGIWSDEVARLAGDQFFTIHGRRGVDVVLDKRLQLSQHHALSMPDLLGTESAHSKGGGLIPSIDGNLIAGPTAEETSERENYATTAGEFAAIARHLSLNQAVSEQAIITYFAGVRSATFTEDFIVERSDQIRNLVHVAGIQSPGLASAPAIAAAVADLVVAARGEFRGSEPLKAKPGFSPTGRRRVDLSDLPLPERAALIATRPDYGRPVCRCEDVTEGEVRDALRSPLGVCSLDAVKRRTRVGAGRCHGGFCMPRVLQLIHEETGLPVEAIRKKAGNSYLVVGRTKNAPLDQLHA